MAFAQFYAGKLPNNARTHHCLFRADSTRCIHRIAHLV